MDGATSGGGRRQRRRSRGAAVAARALGLALAVLAGLAPAAADAAGKKATARQQQQQQQQRRVERGEASFYGAGLHGRRTASGERFDRRGMTAAHPRLPLGSRVVVTNLENGRRVEVEVNDRGPYAKDRAIDLSEAAERRIGITREDGTAPVLIVVASLAAE